MKDYEFINKGIMRGRSVINETPENIFETQIALERQKTTAKKKQKKHRGVKFNEDPIA